MVCVFYLFLAACVFADVNDTATTDSSTTQQTSTNDTNTLLDLYKNKNNVVKTVYDVPLHNVKIGFLTMPSIEPITNVIDKGSVLLYQHMQDIMCTARAAIFCILNDIFGNIKPEIEKIVVAGNNTLYKEITLQFRTACDKFTKYMHKISKLESKGTVKNMCKMNIYLANKIECVIKKMDKQIVCVIKKHSVTNLEEVLAALTKANDDVIGQITKLLDDPNNTIAIIPQILLADPVAIAKLLNNTNRSILKTILKILAKSLNKIKNIIEKSRACTTYKQEDLLNTSNDCIMEILVKELEQALCKISKSIQRVTKNQTKLIERLEKVIPPDVPARIQKVLQEMTNNVKCTIAKITEQQVVETQQKISEKNDYILSTVKRVLG